jgi:UDP-N-acetylmuramate dehydrogenase
LTNLINELNFNNIPFKTDEPMSAHTSFKTGGNASVFIDIEDADTLGRVLGICNKTGTEAFILGKGSNLLVSDDGIKDKAVIHLTTAFAKMELTDETTIEVQAGASLASLCKFALANSLSGLEFAYGIPGSVGGAAYMNAGAYGGEMKDVVVKTTYWDKDEKEIKECTEHEFVYRGSIFSKSLNAVILKVEIQLQAGNKDESLAKMKENMQSRNTKQPVNKPSAGSTFKRQEGVIAAKLIDEAGLKGYRRGGAMVSEKHAGFVINTGGATAEDVLEVMRHVRDVVYANSGITLEPEVRLIGCEL